MRSPAGQGEKMEGQPLLVGPGAGGSQNRPWASPRLQDRPIHSGRGPAMSGFIQQFSPLQSLKGPAPSLTGAQEGNGEESWRESRGSGRCQGPPLWEKQDRTRRKHKESTLESAFQPPSCTPNNNRVLRGPRVVHCKCPYFLIHFKDYGIGLHTLESTDHYSHFTDGETEVWKNTKIQSR